MEFNDTLELMEKLDFAHTKSFSLVYDYMENDREENIKTELAVVNDYSTGKGDPSRVVAKIERATRKRRQQFHPSPAL